MGREFEGFDNSGKGSGKEAIYMDFFRTTFGVKRSCFLFLVTGWKLVRELKRNRCVYMCLLWFMILHANKNLDVMMIHLILYYTNLLYLILCIYIYIWCFTETYIPIYIYIYRIQWKWRPIVWTSPSWNGKSFSMAWLHRIGAQQKVAIPAADSIETIGTTKENQI